MTQRFEKAYNALYNAFMNDTLAKDTCIACAVGNIVADAMAGKVYRNSDGVWKCTMDNKWWSDMFMTSFDGQRIKTIKEDPNVKNLRKRIYILTGYKWNELAKIEKAFENNTKISHLHYNEHTKKEIMEDQFNGLMAVMDVLIELDEIKEGKKYKDVFKSKLEFCKTNLVC
jgi:hypothetical protein